MCLLLLFRRGGDDATVEHSRRGPSRKELWDSLEAKYMAEDASSKKFLKLEHLKEELNLVELGSHLRIEESFKVQDSDKPKGKQLLCSLVVNSRRQNLLVGNVAKLVIIKGIAKVLMLATKLMVQHKGFSGWLSITKRLGHVHFKRMKDMSKDGLIPAFDMDTEKWNKKHFVTFIDYASRLVVRLLDPKLKTLGKRGIECIFVGYVEHSKAFRFCVIEPNESVSVNSIIESRDAIFDENRFSSIPRPSLRIPGMRHCGQWSR
ncbi:hypothetical protein Tco_1090664 [Tanacetum coccineum]|uniref:Retroviral polymerase SH3-like domain-containing protein n=1 Tax=Tanacetum coccineum TaxID=301880 RepID=A0ABQ5I4V2_9ASTR